MVTIYTLDAGKAKMRITAPEITSATVKNRTSAPAGRFLPAAAQVLKTKGYSASPNYASQKIFYPNTPKPPPADTYVSHPYFKLIRESLFLGPAKGGLMMIKFYLSPNGLSFKQYSRLIEQLGTFGWKSSFVWPQMIFQKDLVYDQNLIARSLKSLISTDLYVALVPGSTSTQIEIGAAYMVCEDVILFSKDEVYFTHTGLADAYLSNLPHIGRFCCKTEKIPDLLKAHYAHLVGR